MLKKFSPKLLGRTALMTGAGLAGTISAFCASSALSGVTKKLTSLADAFRGDVAPLITAIGGVALIIAFASAMIAKDSKVSQTAWAWVKRIVIALICVWAISGILVIIEKLGGEINSAAGGK